jgi:hypothetical protein
LPHLKLGRSGQEGKRQSVDLRFIGDHVPATATCPHRSHARADDEPAPTLHPTLSGTREAEG